MRPPLTAILLVLSGCATVQLERTFLEPRMHHLGTPGSPEWEEFAAGSPPGQRLDVRFDARANPAEQTLFLRQDNVKLNWTVELNGRRVGRLLPIEYPLVQAIAVPPGALVDGSNALSIVGPKAADDIRVGEIRLDSRPPAEAVGEAALEVEVVEAPGGRAVPCRITLVDAAGGWPALWPATGQSLAVRPGVVYTGDGRARIGVPAGRYEVFASRGFEYGIDRREVSLAGGGTRRVRLEIRREVSTPRLVACDPHVHTLAHSGHGDASEEERLLTLAGEGVELPVATEHNRNVLYPASAHFTPVVGNEVTTKQGHFNAFPLPPGGPLPDHKIEEWPELMRSIRSAGARVVILNHPCDVHGGFRPFDPAHFNRVTGENLRGPEFAFDAMELVNSGALRSDLMETYRCWFALLNRGHRVSGVGSSDCHDVSRFIVGQGRTYAELRDETPSKLDVGAACRSFLEGRLLVSLGLLVDMRVEGLHGAGAFVKGLRSEVRVEVSVHGPSWSQVDRVELYSNGARIREERIPLATNGGEKVRLSWKLPRPAHDVYLVAVATGPGVTSLHWPLARPYQPASKKWDPRVIGSTNPIRLDGDGDGAYSAPLDYAKALGTDPARVIPALDRFDEAVASQAAGLLQAAGRDVRDLDLKSAADSVKRGFAAYAATLPPR